MNKNIKYFDLVFDECNRINRELENHFSDITPYFLNASQSEICYGLNQDMIIFQYAPERYEYGNIMILKGISIRIKFDSQREYSINDLYSFIKNGELENYRLKTFQEHFALLQKFSQEVRTDLEQNPNWEKDYKEYLKKLYPW